MKDITLGLVGVGRIGVMHARNIASLNGVLHPQGINVRLRLTDVAADHARTVAEAGRRVPADRGGADRTPGSMVWSSQPAPARIRS